MLRRLRTAAHRSSERAGRVPFVYALCLQAFVASWPAAGVADEGTPVGTDGKTDSVVGTDDNEDSADGNEDSATSEAVALYLKAREHYSAGRYHQAIGLLDQALRLDPDSPNLMYNVARVNELLGNLDEAEVYYAKYLEALPQDATEERERAREVLQRLSGARVALSSRESEPTREPVRAPDMPQARTTGNADTWFWLTASTSMALLAGGSTAGIVALRKQRAISDFTLGRDGSAENRAAMVSNTRSWALAADVMLGAGLLAAGGALWLYLARDAEQPPKSGQTHIGWSIQPGAGLITLSGVM